MAEMTQIFLTFVLCLVLLPRTFGSIEEMAQMKSQSAANERTSRINRFDSNTLHEISLNHKELASNISKSLKEINKFIIYTDYWGTEMFLITHSDDIYALGHNHQGRLGFGHPNEVKEPKIIPELCGKNVIDIKCGDGFCVALTQTGQIYTFGYNSGGLTGDGYNDIYADLQQKPIRILDNQTITAIDCTRTGTFVLKQSGQLYWFGWFHGPIYYPTKVVFPSEVKIKSISCGDYHILAQTVDGKAFSWGLDWHDEDEGEDQDEDIPKMISLNENIKQISCGYSHCLLLTTNGKIYSMGSNNYGQLGIGNKENQKIPELVLTDQKEICCYEDISMSLDLNNKLYIWGNINGTVVSPVLSELTSFQEVVNNYAEDYSTLKPIEIFIDEKKIEEYLKNIENQNASIPIKRNEVFIINLFISVHLFKSNANIPLQYN